MEQQSIERHDASRPRWDDLETLVREQSQHDLQLLLEEAVTALLGRAKSARRARAVTFSQFPREQWRHLRATSPLESPSAAVWLRSTAAMRFKTAISAAASIWKLLQVAELTFRRLSWPELFRLIYRGLGLLMAIYTLLDRTSVSGGR